MEDYNIYGITTLIKYLNLRFSDSFFLYLKDGQHCTRLVTKAIQMP